MRRLFVLPGAAAVALLLVHSAYAVNRGATFTPIGFAPDSTLPYSAILSVNPQGTIFMANPSYTSNYCIEWTRENGWGTQIGAAASQCDISSNGTIMASGLYPGGDYAWPGTWAGYVNAWNPIPPDSTYTPCDGSPISYYGMGGEGDYATGLTWQGCQARARGFKWDRATNTTLNLGSPNGRSTRGNAISDDGNTVIGWGTMVFGTRRGAHWENGTWTFFGDPDGQEPKVCIQSGTPCTSNSASPGTGCHEFVDDGSCTNLGTCRNRGACLHRGVCTDHRCVGGSNPGVACTNAAQCRGACVGGTNDGTSCLNDNTCAGACVGGSSPGTSCTSESACTGTCVGPNAGANCASNVDCPDTPVCVNNPNWNDDLFKGEAYDVTPDGQHACGRNMNYNSDWQTGWISNPDGTFTPIPPPESWVDFVDPFKMSDDAGTVVGRVGNPFFGAIPFFWKHGMGTVDLQLFLQAQGIEEMNSWALADLYDVTADGKIMVGRGIDPNGAIQGFIVDVSSMWVCHTPPLPGEDGVPAVDQTYPRTPQTLGIDSNDVAAHLAHGDFLGTCEFMNSGGLSQASSLRARANQTLRSERNLLVNASEDPFQFKWFSPISRKKPRREVSSGHQTQTLSLD